MVPSVTRLSNQGTQRTKGACALNQYKTVPNVNVTSYHLQRTSSKHHWMDRILKYHADENDTASSKAEFIIAS